MTTAYPLCWPVDYKRTLYPASSKFKQYALGKCQQFLYDELNRLGARNIVISSNIPLRQDGLPYANFERRHISDKGVAVYFTWNQEQMVLCCDQWNRFEDNFHAIAKTIEALRGIERWGVSEMLKRTFSGFKELPKPAPAKRDIWTVLGLVGRPGNRQVVVEAYRKLAHERHPDKGGTVQAFQELNEAYQKAINTFV